MKLPTRPTEFWMLTARQWYDRALAAEARIATERRAGWDAGIERARGVCLAYAEHFDDKVNAGEGGPNVTRADTCDELADLMLKIPYPLSSSQAEGNVVIEYSESIMQQTEQRCTCTGEARKPDQPPCPVHGGHSWSAGGSEAKTTEGE